MNTRFILQFHISVLGKSIMSQIYDNISAIIYFKNQNKSTGYMSSRKIIELYSGTTRVQLLFSPFTSREMYFIFQGLILFICKMGVIFYELSKLIHI